jgi:sugar phosphate isomerase/epimerase
MSTNNPNLLANCWTQAGDVDPFRGAHGRRHWSAWSIETRAKKLSDVGFEAIGFFHDDLMHILDEEFRHEEDRSAALKRLDTVLSENGINTVELEFLTEWVHESGDHRRESEEDIRELLLDAATVLDAKHIKIGNLNGYTVDSEQLTRTFEDVADDFAETDTNVGLELFPADPNIDGLDDALEIVKRPDNGGLFLDLWHIVKMNISWEDIGNLEEDDITAVEFNDGYVESEMDFLQETVSLRKIPGEGEFDIEGFIDAIKQTGFDGPWGLEILSEEYRRMSLNDAYRRAYEGGAQYV